MILSIISILTALLFITGTPILLIIAGWVIAASYFVIDFPLANIGVGATDSITSFVFLAVPLFVATGDFLTEGGISQKLVAFARSLVRPLPGATTCSAILASGMFAAVSGSNSATAATMGRMLGPEMAGTGMPTSRAAAIVAAAGTVGVIIPPSVIFIVYGITLNVSSTDLFSGGILPGILMVVMMLVAGSFLSRKYEPSGGLKSLKLSDISRAAAGAWLGFLAIGVIFYGVFGGLFSPTEAAGVVTIFTCLAGLFITRKIKMRNLASIMMRSAAITGMIVPLVGFSILFQQVLAQLGASQALQDLLASVGQSYGSFSVLVLMMLLILLVGAFTESVAVVLILAPMLAPVALNLGFDPVHWGVIFVVGTSIGFITPPYGLNLFVVSAVCKVPFGHVIKSIWPMIFTLLTAWILIAAFPWLSLAFVPSR
jgi:C4-dicarboxylate transporter DctM subunit